MAYTLGIKCAKNLCKRTVLLQFIIENVVTCFFATQCIYLFDCGLKSYGTILWLIQAYLICSCTSIRTRLTHAVYARYIFRNIKPL